jgi:hypothetical protein
MLFLFKFGLELSFSEIIFIFQMIHGSIFLYQKWILFQKFRCLHLKLLFGLWLMLLLWMLWASLWLMLLLLWLDRMLFGLLWLLLSHHLMLFNKSQDIIDLQVFSFGLQKGFRLLWFLQIHHHAFNFFMSLSLKLRSRLSLSGGHRSNLSKTALSIIKKLVTLNHEIPMVSLLMLHNL